MLDVTVVLLEEGFSSTAIMPVEIFHFAGKLWNDLHHRPAEPAFKVRIVSLDGDAVRSVYGLGMTPHAALADVERTDSVIFSTSSLDLHLAFVADSALLPWLRRLHGPG